MVNPYEAPKADLTTASTFVVHAPSTWSRAYFRVYPRDGALFFIHTKGPSPVGQLARAQFGLLGMGLSALYRLATKSRREAKIAAEEQLDPETRLGEHKANVRLDPGQVRSSSIDPPGGTFKRGAHVGQWRLDLADEQPVYLFESVDAMRTAVRLLPPVLGDTLLINVDWDEKKGRFTKQKP